MQKISPCLWFDDKAEEAARFYVSVFGNGKISNVSHYGDAGPRPKGTVLMVTFELEGQEFMAVNGGPQFPFTPAVSFLVKCKTQAEIDRLWNRLLEGGGKEQQCGWLSDKFGLCWQIVPDMIDRYMSEADPVRADRVMRAILQMKKLDVATLEKAYAG